MKRVLLPVLLVLLAPGLARATEFSFGAQNSSGFATSDGTDLPDGDLLLIGTFSQPASVLEENGSNIATLMGYFTEIDSATISSSSVGTGLVTGTSTNLNTTSTGLNVQGQQLYYWVFNASTASTATQQGIFTSSDNPEWQLAPGVHSGDGSGEDTTQCATDIDDLTVGNGGTTLDPGAQIIWGSFGPGINGTTGATDFELASISAVPEPGISALVAGASALGLLSICAFKRREQRA